MTTNSALSSSHPEALAAWDRTQQAYRDYHAAIDEWLKQFPDGFKAMTLGRSGSQRLGGLVWRPEGASPFNANNGYVEDARGNLARDGDGELIPLLDADLWRYDRKDLYWVPRRDARGGKAAKERRLAVAKSLRGFSWQFEAMPGLPEYLPGYPFMGYGCTRLGDEIWVTWSIAAELVRTAGGDHIDWGMWSERKLSEYHAAREAVQS